MSRAGAATAAALAPAQAPARAEAARVSGSAVSLRRLTLEDFRSYAHADIAFDGRPAVFVGANGAGKTNILEAASLLGPGRGLRSADLGALARLAGPGGWAVSARLDGPGGERAIGVGVRADAPGRRRCRIDCVDAAGPTALAEIVRFVWLTPAQDRLFVDSAGERRRFFDRMGQARDPSHAGAQANYERAMRQRQALIETGARRDAQLDALEAAMAEAGVAIAAARRETASALAAAEAADPDGVFPAADIALDGDIERALERAPAADVEEDFMARLRSLRRADAEAGRALFGPHRSDIEVTHRPKGRPARLCSTGEQKALLIGLVLANARALAFSARCAGASAPMILLLDEIAAHLDAARRAALFDIIAALGFQALVTGTDRSLFSAWGRRAQGFEIDSGRICEFRIG